MNGVTLASLRNQRSKTQRQLAKELKLSPSAIAMYETGERAPSLKQAKKIARYFEVAVEAIIFGPDNHESRADERCPTSADETCATLEKVG